MEWTVEQQKVIDLRNRNILVSAAAGSGKTAVLVERIISMVSDNNHPVDIDKLLVVTFTSAAAAEMRERIQTALERLVEKSPHDEHLQRQLTLIHHAQITTIHSFCLYVVRSNCHNLDIDPSFRIGDVGELELMQSDILDEILEDWYEDGTDDFFTFVESYATERSDDNVKELLLKLYNFARSYPWVEDWLEGCRENYDVNSVVELNQLNWMDFLIEHLKLMLEQYVAIYDRILDICNEEDGPAHYITKFTLERDRIAGAIDFDTYEEAAKMILGIKFETKPRKKKTDIFDEKKAEIASLLRDEVRSGIKDIIKSFFFKPVDEMLEDIKSCAVPVNVLIDLVIDFSHRYRDEKRKKNLVDFNDLEHFALEILVKKTEAGVEKTDVAEQYSRYFEEIMIDEYQDSNYVQEVILNSVSRESFGRPNVFMVGDVKQSIYQFRLARPEIFMKKYEIYTETDSKYQRIELHQNFRSRECVLSSINYIFYQIMQQSLGHIEYNQSVALNKGAIFEPSSENISVDTELLLIDLTGTNTEAENIIDRDKEEITQESSVDDEEIEEYSAKEWEVKLIANKIKELTDEKTGTYIWDKGKYRLATYRDIVILLRTISGWAEVFLDGLMSQGIPAYAESQTGYFNTIEIQTILNLLRVIDNPIQDIPLAAVLISPIIGMTSEELAIVKLDYKNVYGSTTVKNGLYDAVCYYVEQYKLAQNEIEGDCDKSALAQENLKTRECIFEIGKKLDDFLNLIKDFRHKSIYMSLHELILYILDSTKYYDYISAMAAGVRRKGNVDMLVEKAISFEGASYKGLFHFVRYIEKLERFQVDAGEVSTVGENENVVRIVSIHKSKGLEFPIVIMGGLTKPFNKQDMRNRAVLLPEYGIGVNYINTVLRTKTPTLIKKVFQRKIMLDNLGEELRILYVAMTRAKERLIMTGTAKNLSDKLKKLINNTDLNSDKLGYNQLVGTNDYLSWIIPAIAKHKSFRNILQELEIPVPFKNKLYDYNTVYNVRIYKKDELFASEIESEWQKAIDKELLSQWDDTLPYDEEMYEWITEWFQSKYNFEPAVRLNASMSVSELKRKAMENLEKLGDIEYEAVQDFNQKLEPFLELQSGVCDVEAITDRAESNIRFIKEMTVKKLNEKAIKRGNAYHKIMQLLDFNLTPTKHDIYEQIDSLIKKNKVTLEEKDMVDVWRIEKFYSSDIGRRMTEAGKNHKLYREQQFLIGISAKEIDKSYDVIDSQTEDKVIIRGIIDTFFEENGKIVLLDYKTDWVDKNSGDEILKNRYKVQLDYYQKALEMIYKKQVTERYIYSFSLGKIIKI